jgi:NADPH2:quinone reductase
MIDTIESIVLGKIGGFDALEIRDVTVPVVGPRQVRVRVHATALNPLTSRFGAANTPTMCPSPPSSATTFPASWRRMGWM